jgi:hypothetical protein
MCSRAWIATSLLTSIALTGTLLLAKPPDLPDAPTIKCATEDRNAPTAQQPVRSEPPAADKSNPGACQARKLYLQGECFRRSGYPVSASLCYQQAHRLCLDGYYGKLAAARLTELGVSVTAADISADEDAMADDGSEEESAVLVPADDRLAELLEQCQRALTDGGYQLAQNLVRQALAIDPDCCPAQALAATIQHGLQVRTRCHVADTARPEVAATATNPPTLFIDPPQTDLFIVAEPNDEAACFGLSH